MFNIACFGCCIITGFGAGVLPGNPAVKLVVGKDAPNPVVVACVLLLVEGGKNPIPLNGLEVPAPGAKLVNPVVGL